MSKRYIISDSQLNTLRKLARGSTARDAITLIDTVIKEQLVGDSKKNIDNDVKNISTLYGG